ncbi:MAG: hypothetical protein IJX67_10945 [Oscillospiraceae bacterium]|nr:hypothetical protein [Oscillospiraceae bacterium]
MKTGWWQIKCTLEGEDVTPNALSDATCEHIASLIKRGFHAGEIIEEDDDE